MSAQPGLVHPTTHGDLPHAPHPSAMRTRMSAAAEFLGRHLFAHLAVSETLVAKIRDLSERGTVIYVLRDRSLIDYFMVNYLLRREGLPLPVFANGITSTALAPLRELLGRAWSAAARRLHPDRTAPGPREVCRQAVMDAHPVLIFMRDPRRGRRGHGSPEEKAVDRASARYLRDIVADAGHGAAERFIVLLAPFRGRAFRRREPGVSTLLHDIHDAPRELRKLLRYWFHSRDLLLTAGNEICIGDFSRRYRGDGEERLVRRLVRAIQIYLHREERVVLGPPVVPRKRIRSMILDDEQTRAFLAKQAIKEGVHEARLRKRAEANFDEMAAEFNSTVFAVVAWLFRKIWNRMFTGIETIGFEKVVEKAKNHPIVLVPCHRSHFDYMILSYLFYLHFVSPPHIAAGINMAFWPMSRIFRASGAYFIRRTFGDDEVYKYVFRRYQQFLIGEGYTQEFFIEGGRSRTGKMMTPRLGMLSAIVGAYLSGVRRNLYLVPVSIHYGRIVEEDAYQAELAGGEKEPESFGALMRARRFLKQKYGTVYISFADPISLEDELGERKKRFVEHAGDPATEAEKKKFIQRLGFRILHDVNRASVAGATSISATVLLGAPNGGIRYRDFRERANALAQLTQYLGIVPTSSLARNAGDFRESISFLSASGFVEVLHRGHEEILVVNASRRLALDFYKNNLIHAFLVPSLLTSCLREGVALNDLPDRIWKWLDFFRYEFALPARAEVCSSIERLLDYYRQTGALSDEDQLVEPHPLVAATSSTLQNYREAYYVAALAIHGQLGHGGMPQKALIDDIRRHYKTSLLLGEVCKPEGSSVAIFRDALNRYTEMGFIRAEKRGRSGRDHWVVRGPSWPPDHEPLPENLLYFPASTAHVRNSAEARNFLSHH